MKMYYCVTHFTRPRCRKVESALKAVVLADSKEGAYSRYYKKNQQWIELYRDYKDFHVSVWEQEDGFFSFS